MRQFQLPCYFYVLCTFKNEMYSKSVVELAPSTLASFADERMEPRNITIREFGVVNVYLLALFLKCMYSYLYMY